MRKRKWTITIEVVEVKGGAGVEFQVDHPFGMPAPRTEAVVGMLRQVAAEMEQEAAEANS